MTNFWTALATYCSELAPVTGPLLQALSETASAIDRASSPALKDASPRPQFSSRDA